MTGLCGKIFINKNDKVEPMCLAALFYGCDVISGKRTVSALTRLKKQFLLVYKH